jgi:hypothetical protein
MQIVTVKDFNELPNERLYRYGAMTPQEAAAEYQKKFGVPPDTCYKHTSSRGWVTFSFTFPKLAIDNL